MVIFFACKQSVKTLSKMLTQERALVEIENEMTKRVELALKDSQLPVDLADDRSTVMGQKQQLAPMQRNHYPAAKPMRQPAPKGDNGSLNFSTSSEEFDLPFMKKPKTIRDPMSHRIIEKRRRDRMNNCLADLSRLIPTNYLKQGQGRIEKTEIIEMAIKHIKNLTNTINQPTVLKSSLPDRYLGFKECQDEVMRYLVEVEGWDAMDKLCTRLMGHLEQAGEKFRIMNDDSLSKVAKEEQYRHADEEMGTLHNLKKPFLQESGGQPTLYPSAQSAPFQPPNEHQGLIASSGPVTQDNIPMETQTTFTNMNNFASAQQITKEHLKRDKHLWTLIQTEYNSTAMDDSGVSTDPGSSGSNGTEIVKHSEQTSVTNSKALSETSSANSFTRGTAESSSERNGNSVYKFKHNITKRFSLEGKQVSRSDSSSVSSSEEKRAEKGKRKFRHVRSWSPTSSHFINAESPNVVTGSNEESGSSDNTEDAKMSNYLPGFVLHPNGTHYIPISFQPSSISGNVFSKNGHAQSIYHPISIPVNFGGPLLFMKKFSIHSSSSASYGSSAGTDSPSRCSAENSSSCHSENSPSPQQFGYKSPT